MPDVHLLIYHIFARLRFNVYQSFVLEPRFSSRPNISGAQAPLPPQISVRLKDHLELPRSKLLLGIAMPSRKHISAH